MVSQGIPSPGFQNLTTQNIAGGVEVSPSAQFRRRKSVPPVASPYQDPFIFQKQSTITTASGIQPTLPDTKAPVTPTPVSNESKITSHNEERLEIRMAEISLTTDTRSPKYQEHVCAEDFYKQPQRVYESVVILAKDAGLVETEALESDKLKNRRGSSVNEDGRVGSSWRFESAVLWNDGRKGERSSYETSGDVRKVENEPVVTAPVVGRMENQSAGQIRRSEASRGASAAFNRESIRNMGTKPRGENGSAEVGVGRETTLQDKREPNGRRNQPLTNIPPITEGVAQDLAVDNLGSRPSTTKTDTPADNEGTYGTNRRLDMGITETHGNKIRKDIQSNNGGWKFAFELFELGKVPDPQSFLVDVLEEFTNRRPYYWEALQQRGFNVDEYRKSDDDDLFLQNSYTNAAIEALQKSDSERAMGLLVKAWEPLDRRFSKKTSHEWILTMETMEWLLYAVYAFSRRSRISGTNTSEDSEAFVKQVENVPEFEPSRGGKTSGGVKYWLQFHFLITLLLDVGARHTYATKWRRWKITYSDENKQKPELMRVATDMEGIELLRYATEEAAAGSTSNWNDRLEVQALGNVSAEYLLLFASLGHKGIVLKNLETLYDFDTIVGWDGNICRPPNLPRKTVYPFISPTTRRFSQSSVQSPSENLSEELVPIPTKTAVDIPKPPPPRAPPAPPRRQGSIRHPSPWESGLPSASASRSQPRKSSGQLIPEENASSPRTGPVFSPTDRNGYNPEFRTIPPPEKIRTLIPPTTPNLPRSPPRKVHEEDLKAQHLINLRDQPIRLSDDCTVDEINVITDYKQAVRSSPNLDVYIGTLASLRLINLISGNPEYRPWTPLIEAICNQRWEAAKALIRLGASFDLGYPFHTALSRHFMNGSRARCAKVVEKKLAQTNGLSTDEYFFIESSSLINYMIESGADVNAQGTANTDLEPQIKTYPIHLAALDLVPTSLLVSTMLKKGADVWATDANGELAIDYARRANNQNTIKQLEKAMTVK